MKPNKKEDVIINLKRSWIALTSLVITGCTQIGVDIANVPSKLSSTDRVTEVAYGQHQAAQLDIYIPDGATALNKLPVLVFFYGGSWQDGNKDMYQFIGETFAQQGYVVVIPDYRKYPEVKFPAFVEDGAEAIAWTFNNIDQYHGNTNQLFVLGHSAGAHIGALICANPHYLDAYQLEPSIIDAFSGLAGPYDFVPVAEDLKDIFGPPERYPQMQVTTFIDGTEPPMQLLWGEQDELVGRRNMDLLSAKIREQKGDVTTKTYPNAGHADMVSSLIWFLPSKAPIVDDVTQFFDQHK